LDPLYCTVTYPPEPWFVSKAIPLDAWVVVAFGTTGLDV